MKKVLLLLVFSVFLWQSAGASPYVFDYTSGCQEAYRSYLSLDLEKGNMLIRKELIANPYNLMATYLGDYHDCLLLLLNGDKANYNQRYGNMSERLRLLERGDAGNPWFRLCRAGVYFHWALVAVRFGENFKAANTFRKSFLLLKENDKLFPTFPQNKIFLGVEEAVIGTLPSDYQWLASIFGMKGSVKGGINKIQDYLDHANVHTPLWNEAVIFNCYLRFYLLSHQQQVWNFVNSNNFPVSDNLFHALIRANLALNFRKGDIALATLEAIEKMPLAQQFPVVDYEMGSALLQRTDPKCIQYFTRFLSRYKGRIFVKDAWQKLAYAAYLDGDLSKATYYRKQILSNGVAQTDADKQAQRFASEPSWPQVSLLKARLLTDGGYYSQALRQLQQTKPNDFDATERLEYYFWLARIYDEMGATEKSIELYRSTIELGRSRKEHFAARSALQLGMLYEKRGNIAEAIAAYKDCLSMKNHDFQANIDQQAKAGINRLTVKP